MDVTRAVVPQMRKQKSGVIINITSLGGLIARPYHIDLFFTKFAIEGFTETLSQEYMPFNIKAKTIAPSSFGTGFTEACNTYKRHV